MGGASAYEGGGENKHKETGERSGKIIPALHTWRGGYDRRRKRAEEASVRSMIGTRVQGKSSDVEIVLRYTKLDDW